MVSPNSLPSYLAFLIAGLLVAVSIADGGFVPLGTDSSAYVSAAELWRTGDLFRDEPLHFWASWPNAVESASPLGYRSGPIRGTEVSAYPLGFPLLNAAAVSLVGSSGSYLVAPIMGGLLVWCTFVLAREMAGALAGLLAAALIASSPLMLLHTVHPMSDVPAAACWIAAWALSLAATVGAAVAAGAMVAMAILVRPNLAPLAMVVGAVILIGGRAASRRHWQWRAAATFIATAVIGPAIVLWSQAVLYGSPFESPYPGWQQFFSRAHIPSNLRTYPRLLAETHTLLPLAGLLVVPAALFSRRVLSRPARVIALSAGAILVVNIALYLPYLPYDHWPFLRFLLPGLAALFIAFAGVVAFVTRWTWGRLSTNARGAPSKVEGRARWLAAIVPIAAIIVAAQGRPFVRYALHDWQAQTRVRLMGHYLRETLPSNAALLSFVHSGALAYYTRKDVIRLDIVDAHSLDRVVDDLVRHNYHPVFVLDQALEESPFKQRFPDSRFGRLDWAPRAIFTTVTAVLYLDPADRQPYLDGKRWPVDVLR